jgi:hypothetical protein
MVNYVFGFCLSTQVWFFRLFEFLTNHKFFDTIFPSNMQVIVKIGLFFLSGMVQIWL